ncbi:tRNA (5-methylaminomethyl-2-thiouridine)(34)-methyltransferase MnmD [soil metagenome]
MNRELIKTADGSHSLYVKDLDEHYHSIHGAIQEALHVFIKTGLQFLVEKGKTEIHILEIGFGTGLNALLTLIEAEKLNIKVNYTSLEAFPLEQELIQQLNYVELVSTSNGDKNQDIQKSFDSIHACDWGKENQLTSHFTLNKIKNTLQAIQFKKSFDLIYFDAFGPRVQPEMWTEELFSKIFSSVNPNGCLVTYCAQGEVKRTLKKAGFEVETLPGPPRKREMVRGTKNNPNYPLSEELS